MSSLAFVYLARNAGPSFLALAEDIASLTQPGDHVVIVEDSGGAEIAAQIGQFTEMTGWGAEVSVTTILTGTAADGDLGIAANLALQALCAPGARRDRVVFVCAGNRIDRTAFEQARTYAEAKALDVLAFPLRQWSLDLGRVIDGPDFGDHVAGPTQDPLSRALSLSPALDGLFLHWPITARCAEAQDSYGALGFWWQSITTAEKLEVYDSPLGHRAHPPEPDAALFRAITALTKQDPSAVHWARTALARLLSGVTTGAVTGLLEAGPALSETLKSDADDPLLQAFVAGDHSTARHLLWNLGRIGHLDPDTPDQSLLSAPEVRANPAPMQICLTGQHIHRIPFSYEAFDPLWQSQITLTQTPADADLILIAHPHNLNDAAPAIGEAIAGGTPLALLSEEPFWDTLFSPDPFARVVDLPAGGMGSLRAHQVNHHRGPLFDYDQIPYFLMTDRVYIDRYAKLFARNATLSPQDWAEAFAKRPTDVTFMAERRPEAFHDFYHPIGDVMGLCAWRTRLAEGCTRGEVARLGKSWGNGPSRFDLTDWHADKLAQLDGQTRILSGIENTHLPTYMTEKFFDAFACGTRPLFLASPGHRVHEMGVPEGAWLNLWGMSVAQAVDRIEAAEWDAQFFADYAAAQARFAALFNDTAIRKAERTRFGTALIQEVRRLISCGPA